MLTNRGFIRVYIHRSANASKVLPSTRWTDESDWNKFRENGISKQTIHSKAPRIEEPKSKYLSRVAMSLDRFRFARQSARLEHGSVSNAATDSYLESNTLRQNVARIAWRAVNLVRTLLPAGAVPVVPQLGAISWPEI